MSNSNWEDILSVVVGWVYFAAWTVSFWPQIISNFRRKSVVGLSFDYSFLNVIGFACYSAYNVCLYFSPVSQQQYLEFNHEPEHVEINDVAFALHAIFASSIIAIQIGIFDRGNQTLSWLGRIMIPVYILGIGIFAIVIAAMKFQWYYFLLGLGYVKLSISLLKYCPQVYLNFARKSTEGWNVWNVLLDFTGGVLSVFQIIFDSVRHGQSLTPVFSDPKFILGNMSILFDIIFMVQHFCLYRHNAGPEYKKIIEEGYDSSSGFYQSGMLNNAYAAAAAYNSETGYRSGYGYGTGYSPYGSSSGYGGYGSQGDGGYGSRGGGGGGGYGSPSLNRYGGY